MCGVYIQLDLAYMLYIQCIYSGYPLYIQCIYTVYTVVIHHCTYSGYTVITNAAHIGSGYTVVTHCCPIGYPRYHSSGPPRLERWPNPDSLISARARRPRVITCARIMRARGRACARARGDKCYVCSRSCTVVGTSYYAVLGVATHYYILRGSLQLQ